MRFLVFGAGSIGSAFGGFLSQKHEVTLLGRKWHIDPIRKYGLKVTGIWGNHSFNNFAGLISDERDLIRAKQEYDYILVTTKANDTANCAKVIAKIVTPRTFVVSLQNGLGNIEALQKYIPSSQIIAGRVIFGVVLGKGSIEITVFGDKTLLGEVGKNKGIKAARILAKIFCRCGLESRAVKEIEPYIWGKVTYNCALNPLATILQVTYGDLLRTAETRSLMKQITKEIYAIAKKRKIRMMPRGAEAYIKLLFGTLIPRTAAHHPSMLQAISHGKLTEINALNGAITEMGKSLAVPSPANEILTEIIKAKEKLSIRQP